MRSCSASLLPARSVVLSSRAPIGYVAIPQVEFCTNQGCKSIDLKGLYDPEFVHYNISFNMNKLKHLGEGTTFAEISKASLSRIEMLFPRDRLEQTKIATVLATVDEAIEQTEALIEKQTRIKTGLVQDFLTKGIDEHGNIRSEETHAFKDSALGRIPVEWASRKLVKLAACVDPQPDHRTPPEVLDGFPYIGISDFQADGRINFEAARKISLKALQKQEQSFRVEEGDFIFGKIGTIGFPKRLPLLPTYALSANVILVKPFETPSFVYWLMTSTSIARQVDKEIHATSQPAFGIQKIRNLDVVVPPIPERERIGLLLDEADCLIKKEEHGCGKLRLIKAGLMQDLLTNRVPVTTLLGRTARTVRAS